MNYFLAYVSFLMLLFTFVIGDAPPVIKQFTVQPGGRQYSVSNERAGVTCSFTYECQGGTNEKWVMVIVQMKEPNTFGCFVEREGGGGASYIFFQKFKLQVEGKAEVHGGQVFGKSSALPTREFMVDKKQKAVLPTKDFKSELSRATIEYSLIASKKQEL